MRLTEVRTVVRTVMTASSAPRQAALVPNASPTTGKILEGCLAVHKPLGISSAQALRDVQKHFNPSKLFAPWLERERASRNAESRFEKGRRSKAKRGPPGVKIGHGGTLDPEATGVLIAGIGSGTKSLSDFLACSKSYECVVLFGAATDTYDAAGKLVAKKPYDHITQDMVEKALDQFRGKIMQKPPIYSALHVQGKRLYEYARDGIEVPVEIKARPVEVMEMELLDWFPGGTHEHQWPELEAGTPEKAIAGKLLNLEPSATSLAEHSSGERKRARESSSDELDSAVQETPDSKRIKDSDSTPKMSGALMPPNAGEELLPDSSADGAKKSSESAHTANDRGKASSVGPPAAKIRMTVGSGFYVRSLCHDLGAAVDSLALMSTLVRSRQGDFEIGKNVLEFSDLEKGEEVWGPQVESMLEAWNASKTSATSPPRPSVRRRNSSSSEN